MLANHLPRRLAQAQLARGQWAAAVDACRRGEALSPKNSEGHTEFTPLLDRIAVAAARAGSLAGFDGLQLEVRGEEGGWGVLRWVVRDWGGVCENR